MSYLPSGKTPRTMFSQMPPKRHDLDPIKSEVLAYIGQEMGCDLAAAIRAFNSMRHPKCRVLVFDKIERQWKGCEFRPSDAETSELSIIREHRAFERQLAVLKSTVRRLQDDVEGLKRKTAKRTKGKRNDDRKADEPHEEQATEPVADTSIDDLLAKFRNLSEIDEKPSKTKRQQPENTIESMVAQAWG
jgi:hypothetical protein